MKAFLSENIQISTRLCKKKKIAELIKRNISVNEEMNYRKYNKYDWMIHDVKTR